MDVPVRSRSRVRGGLRTAARLALAAALVGAAAGAAAQGEGVPADAAVKAAFLYNFAKFAEWPNLPARAPIVTCVVGDRQIADTLVAIVLGNEIGGHGLSVTQPTDDTTWGDCQVLFVAASQATKSEVGLSRLRTLPVLTVSDRAGFSRGIGIIELYVTGGRMRFAINVDSVEHSGLRLSSRLLGLARVVRDLDPR